jgi:hypothetical protein
LMFVGGWILLKQGQRESEPEDMIHRAPGAIR